MATEHKRLKALARAKAIRRERNIGQRNRPKGGDALGIFAPKRRTYRLWDI